MSAIGEPARTRDRTVGRVYIDRDMGAFQKVAGSAPSAQTNQATVPSTADTPSETDSLLMQFNPGQPVDIGSVASMQYLRLRDIGQLLGGFAFSVVAGGNFTVYQTQGTAYGGGTFEVVRSNDFSTTSIDVAPSSAGSSFTLGQTSMSLRIRRSGTATTVGPDTHWGAFYNIWVRGLIVDKTGAQITGAFSYANPYVLPHEVVADLLGSMLTTYDGANAVIDTSSTHQIDQFAFPDGITAEQILAELMKLEPDFYWHVGPADASGKSSFTWRKWPTKARYVVSLRDGIDLPGADAERYNRVTIGWVDRRGRERTTSYESVVPELETAGPGGTRLTREPEVQDLGTEVGSQANADRAGAQFLAEHGTPPVSGTLTVGCRIYDNDLGRHVEPWEIEPGHLLRIRELVDDAGDLAVTDRDGKATFRIIGMTYQASDNAAALELDAPPKHDEVTLAQVASRRIRKR